MEIEHPVYCPHLLHLVKDDDCSLYVDICEKLSDENVLYRCHIRASGEKQPFMENCPLKSLLSQKERTNEGHTY